MDAVKLFQQKQFDISFFAFVLHRAMKDDSRRQHCPNSRVEPPRTMQERSSQQHLVAKNGHKIEDGKIDVGRGKKESTGL